MRKLYKLTFVTLAAVALCTALRAQQGPDAAGGQATGSGGSLSFSVGQIDYVDISATAGNVNQGVQQAAQSPKSKTGVAPPPQQLVFNAVVYPNPATGHIILSIPDGPIAKNAEAINETNTINSLRYMLYTVDGKLLKTDKINGSQISISLAGMASGTYFLAVENNTGLLKSFTIIKAR